MRETTDATAIFAPLWRRKWAILAVGVIAGVATYLYYKHQTATFASSTQVYLGASAEEATAGEKQPHTSTSELNDQASVVNSIVIPEVRKQFRHHHKGALVRKARVKARAQERSLFILISGEARTARGTELIVNTVAQTYVRRRNATREAAINRAIELTRRQLSRIEAAQVPAGRSSASGKTKGSASPSATSVIDAANLSAKINQLEASRAAAGAQQVNPANSAELVSPKPKQDGIFGFVIGIVLASIAAYALGRLDRRLRTLEGIESIFGSQILAVLPKVARPIVRRTGQPSPSRQLLEPLRRLHTMLKLGVGLDEQGSARRILLVLSPDAGDGKSTLVANLALVQRDAGERVTIVEANFRRPVQSRLLGVDGNHGLADVLMGRLSVDEAAQRVTPLPVAAEADVPEQNGGAVTTAVATRSAGALFLLAGSQAVANPPALLADAAMPELLQSLRQDFDYVLVDAPSPLEVSDVMPLLRIVDGVVLLARAGHTREVSAHHFMQLIGASSTAPILGTVANCVAPRDLARHGSSGAPRRSFLARMFGS